MVFNTGMQGMHHIGTPTLSPTKRAPLVRAINSASKPVGGAHQGKTPKRLGPTLGHLQLIYLDCSSNKLFFYFLRKN